MKAVEIERIGSRVLVRVDGGYERFVDDVEWDTDPEAILAEIALFVETPIEPIVVTASKGITVELSEKEIEAKQAEMIREGD